MRVLWLAAAALLLLPSCANPDGASSVEVDVSDAGDGQLLPDPTPANAGIRSRRRMDIDQLDASIRQATGGIGWMEGETNLFVELGATLGKPDFLTSTAEDLAPSALFQKFLGDAARAVCAELAAADLAATPETRVLIRDMDPSDVVETNPEGVDANMRRLLLRFHGTPVSTSGTELEPWTQLFQSGVEITGDPLLSWRAVCVALITHPDFYSY